VSLHREENVDNPDRLKCLLDGLANLVKEYSIPAIVSTHPRTRKRIEEFGFSVGDQIRLLKPFGFFDYNNLQMNSFCVISDSGTIAEEASILGFAAATPRDAIERPEGLDVGCLVMMGVDKQSIFDGVSLITQRFAEVGRKGVPLPYDYAVRNTSERVAALIVGTARLSNSWDGIRSF
jgi:UDP-N-acetylglucosamine 2-epimerase (non-hydrolysing)